MDSERWQRLQSLFALALAQTAADRAAFVEKACGDDTTLRDELLHLLAQETGITDPVDEIVGDAAGHAVGRAGDRRAWIDRRLGPWRITSHLADGGMGAVYRAQRADGQYEQQAAVKLINPAFLSEQAAARLAAERQILAKLAHPSIARLLDGGTTDDGAPYLVMEYVEGEPIDVYCNGRALDTIARLRLFQQVCAAVDAAHRSLIVHRDLKPANILVDRDGRPKLLDFGIAKLLEAPETALTAAQQRVLTPTHASPEQVRGEAVTTATDVYALGVLLYELLSGRLPFRVEGRSASAATDLARQILETEPPPPSAAAASGSNARVEAARKQGAAPSSERLGRELRGDLDNIVLMALRKEPARRYASAQALADDIERYLADRPVLARKDSWPYRTAKLVKRRRRAFAVAAVVAVAVLAQAAYFVQRIVAERDAARVAQARAERIVEFMQEMLSGADKFANAGREVTVRDILESGAQRIRTELADQPVEQARLMETIGSSYQSLSMYQPALELYRRSYELRRDTLGPEAVETLRAKRAVGVGTQNAGDLEGGRKLLEETLAAQRAILPPDSTELAETYNELGTVLRLLGKPKEALVQLRACYAILEKLPPTHSQHRFLPRVMGQIGIALSDTGDHAGAIAAYRVANELFERTGQPDDPTVGANLHNIGLELNLTGRPEEALPYLQRALEHTRRTLGESTQDYEAQASSLARVYGALRRFDEAEKYAQIALQTAQRLYGVEHQYYAYNIANIARLRQLQGKHAEALPLWVRANRIYRKAYGPYHRLLASSEIAEAESLLALGRPREALAELDGVLARMSKDPDRERHIEAVGRSFRGAALAAVGRNDEARGELIAGVEALRKIFGDKHSLTRSAARRLVRFLDEHGQAAQADRYRELTEPAA